MDVEDSRRERIVENLLTAIYAQRRSDREGWAKTVLEMAVRAYDKHSALSPESDATVALALAIRLEDAQLSIDPDALELVSGAMMFAKLGDIAYVYAAHKKVIDPWMHIIRKQLGNEYRRPVDSLAPTLK